MREVRGCGWEVILSPLGQAELCGPMGEGTIEVERWVSSLCFGSTHC